MCSGVLGHYESELKLFLLLIDMEQLTLYYNNLTQFKSSSITAFTVTQFAQLHGAFSPGSRPCSNYTVSYKNELSLRCIRRICNLRSVYCILGLAAYHGIKLRNSTSTVHSMWAHMECNNDRQLYTTGQIFIVAHDQIENIFHHLQTLCEAPSARNMAHSSRVGRATQAVGQ